MTAPHAGFWTAIKFEDTKGDIDLRRSVPGTPPLFILLVRILGSFFRLWTQHTQGAHDGTKQDRGLPQSVIRAKVEQHGGDDIGGTRFFQSFTQIGIRWGVSKPIHHRLTEFWEVREHPYAEDRQNHHHAQCGHVAKRNAVV